MARGSDTAKAGATSGLNFSGSQQNNAAGLYSTLAPQLASEAAHPSGMTPQDLAATNTAEQQSTGGGQSAAVGQGALLAGRTRNAGTADAAIAQSSRQAGQQLSEGALQTQLKNAALKESQRQAAMRGEEGLYGTSVSGANQALGESANETNADTNAVNASWDWAKDLVAPIASAGIGAYGRVASAGQGGGR